MGENGQGVSREPIFGSGWKAGGITVVAMLVGLYGFNWLSAAPSTYSCAGIVSDVVTISADNAASSHGVKILDVGDVKEVSRQGKHVECSGVAILSNATNKPVTFRSTTEYGSDYISYQFP